MIDLYYWPTPNGHKITIFLEEANLDYRIVPVNIGQGEQFRPDFLRIAPNHRIPAIVDHAPDGTEQPISIFESGAILLYLADKTKHFISADLKERNTALEWLFWQMAGLGPMAGQNHHFSHYAPEVIPYAIERYVKETSRLYAVLNNQLKNHEFIADSYSIADMACYPWILRHEKQSQNLADFPHLHRWVETIKSRPAVQKAYAVGEKINMQPVVDDKSRSILFGQDSSTINSLHK